MTRTLDAFPNKFWYTPLDPTLLPPGPYPTSVQEALLVMGDESWNEMVDALFEDWVGIDISDVMTLIRETNTCEGLDSELDVWIDAAGDFKIKVYYV